MHNPKKFVETVLHSRDADDASEPRSGFAKERPTAQAFSLRVRFKDGRRAQGLPWTLFAGYEWCDEGREEQLSLIFSHRVIDVRGQHLWRLVEELDEGQLKALQEHDSKEVDLLRSENADLRPGHHKPVIVSIDVTPPFAEAVREIRGDTDEQRLRAAGERRGR